MEKEEENDQPLINEEENNQIITDENEYKNKEETDENDEDIQKIEINEHARRTIYICLIILNTFSGCDGGIIPQQTANIKKDFGNENDDALFGFFGSVDYIGRVIGALIFTFILGKMNRKMILFFTLILKAITLFIAIPFKGSIINIIFRGISGISQVFYTSYLPVWCDQYGKKKHRTIMVMIVQLGLPIGIILGYGMGMICDLILPEDSDYKGWRISFGIEGIILIICALIILGFKKKYFSEKFILIDDNIGKEEKKSEQDEEKLINFNNVKKILSNKLFLFTTLSNSVSFFGMGIVQYWGEIYMELVLKMDATFRFIIFSLLCLLGPILGMIFGGLVCSKLGGYNKRRAMVFIIILLIVAALLSSLITLGNNTIVFIIFSWSYLFFLCAAVPPESGIIIASLENNLRGDGFALSNSLMNLLGSFPPSYIFGALSDLIKSRIPKEEANNYSHYVYSWMLCMVYNYIGVILIIIAGFFRFRIKGDLSSNPDEELNEAENIGIDTDTVSSEPNKKESINES